MSRLRAASPQRETALPLRQHAEQAFSRAAGAPLVAGNSARILRNAAENYPAWLAAIRVFEWNGPMLHSKTAVADCRWARSACGWRYRFWSGRRNCVRSAAAMP